MLKLPIHESEPSSILQSVRLTDTCEARRKYPSIPPAYYVLQNDADERIKNWTSQHICSMIKDMYWIVYSISIYI